MDEHNFEVTITWIISYVFISVSWIDFSEIKRLPDLIGKRSSIEFYTWDSLANDSACVYCNILSKVVHSIWADQVTEIHFVLQLWVTEMIIRSYTIYISGNHY